MLASYYYLTLPSSLEAFSLFSIVLSGLINCPFSGFELNPKTFKQVGEV